MSFFPRGKRSTYRIQTILDAQTEPWGVKVVLVELKHIDLPQEMQRAMAKQAEAERERRAKIIHAEGEFQASQKLADAAGDHCQTAEWPCTCGFYKVLSKYPQKKTRQSSCQFQSIS